MQRDSPVWPNGDDVKGEGAAAGAAEKSEAALEAAPNPEKAAGAAGCRVQSTWQEWVLVRVSVKGGPMN